MPALGARKQIPSMIITLAGYPGSGKSTVRKLLAERLGWKAYSMGDLRCEMATKRGMSIVEFNAECMKSPEIDRQVDDYQKNLSQTSDNLILDGLMSWHIVPQSLKVFLAIDPRVAAERIFTARRTETGRDDEPQYASIEEAQEAIAARMAQNGARYAKWYGANPLDESQYDLIIDTTQMTPDTVVDQIMGAIS